MNFNAILIIAVILSMILSIWCASAGFGVGDEICIQQIVCDNNGKQYPTKCALDNAIKENPNLMMADCPGAFSI